VVALWNLKKEVENFFRRKLKKRNKKYFSKNVTFFKKIVT
jgi:hypothetical protein